MSADQIVALLPVLLVLATGLVLLMLEVFSSGSDRGWAAGLTALGLFVALYFALTWTMGDQGVVSILKVDKRAAPILVDRFATYAWVTVIAAGGIASLLSPAFLEASGSNHAEYYALICFAVVGMMVMAAAGDLFTLFLGIEVMSVAVYVLTSLRRKDPRSIEAALKYFVMGAFATGFLLFGIALIFGASGAVGLPDIAAAVKAGSANTTMMGLGIVLFLIGMGFKIAAVPFHLWAPDVYEGAPTPITGFMAVGVKAAAFVGLVRFVVVGFGPKAVDSAVLIPLLTGLAYATILGGNLLAVMQRNVKRMLAYSSIAHAGYALIGVVAAAKGDAKAAPAVLFYLGTYTFMTLGAFGVLTFLERKDGGAEAERFGAFAGVGFRHPALGVAMALFMVALAGMPPTGGFFGKLYVFSSALSVGDYGLVFAGIAGSIISIYYYLRVIVAFYMRDVPDPGPLPTATSSRALTLGLAVAAVAVVYLGVFPGRWIDLGVKAVSTLSAG
jgi:NADH-quinone oxidoreductase subunit N